MFMNIEDRSYFFPVKGLCPPRMYVYQRMMTRTSRMHEPESEVRHARKGPWFGLLQSREPTRPGIASLLTVAEMYSVWTFYY